MALKKCGECGKEISSKAPNCPGCGAPVAQTKTRPRQFGFLSSLLIIGGSLFFLIMWVSGGNTGVTSPPPRNAPPTPQKVIQAPETSDSMPALTDHTPTAPREFSSPPPTNTPEAPPAPPDDFDGGATVADQANKEQRDKGLVLWKGEWMSPEKRARLRAADDVAYRFVQSKTEQSGHRNVMDLYAYDGKFNLADLKAFCKERKDKSTAQVFYYVVIFDKATNAQFPSTPFTTEYSDGTEEGISAQKHIRAIYCYNKLNGYSVLRYQSQNIWAEEKIK